MSATGCSDATSSPGDVSVGVLGAGATGAYLAARLAESGVHVTLVARGESLQRIRRTGIEVDDRGRRSVQMPAVVAGPEDATDEVDVVLFCVKSYDTEQASKQAELLAGSKGHVLCLQNGVRNEQVLADRLGADRVLSGVLYVGAERVAPGVVRCTSAPRVIVGPYAGSDGSAVLTVQQVLGQADIECSYQEDVSAAKWVKFLFNCGLNPLTAITGQTLGRLLADARAADAFGILVDEALSVAVAEGAPLPPGARTSVMETARRMDISSSMAEDLAAGRAIELDAFTGYVLELGERHGTPTPATRVAHGVLAALDAARGR